METLSKLARYACMACAIGLIPTWVDLMGHTQLLSAQADLVEAAIANAHYCLLIGMVLGGLVVALLSKTINAHKLPTALVAGACGAVVTLVYALTANGIVAGVMVAASGFLIIVLYTGVFSLIATTTSLSCIAIGAMIGMAGKALLLPLVDAVLPGGGTIVFTCLVPLAAALFAAGYDWLVYKDNDLLPADQTASQVQGGTADKSPVLSASAMSTDVELASKGARTPAAVIALIIISALVFAMTRAGSNLQLWGSAHVTPPMTVAMGIAASTVFIIICYATFVQTPHDTMLRFFPSLAIQLVAYGLLWLGLLDELGITTRMGVELFSTYTEVYSHTFYFMVSFFGLIMLGGARGVRLYGLQWSLFSAALFVAAIVGRASTSPTRFTLVAALYVVLAAMFLVAHHMYGRDQVDAIQNATLGLGRASARSHVRSGDAIESMSTNPANPASHSEAGPKPGAKLESKPEPKPDPEPENPVVATVDEITARYDLSEREHEVLALLVQGRTRAYIGNELSLASGTVSTYITRIYEKLRVHSKQEMLSMVYEHIEARTARDRA